MDGVGFMALEETWGSGGAPLGGGGTGESL